MSRIEIALERFIIETQKGFAEIKERQEKTDEQISRLDEQQKKTDEQISRLDEQQKKTDEQLKKLENLFVTQWGKLIESLVRPSVLKLFNDRGIEVESTSQRVEAKAKNGDKTEFDIIVRNSNVVVAIEVKTTLNVETVDEHIEKRLLRYYDFLPNEKNSRVFGAVAYINVVEEADKYAYRKGLFVLGLSGENIIEIKNDEKFVPKDFGEHDNKLPQ